MISGTVITGAIFIGGASRAGARCAKEDHQDLAAHIEGGQEGREDQQDDRKRRVVLAGRGQDFIFGEETQKAEQSRPGPARQPGTPRK